MMVEAHGRGQPSTSATGTSDGQDGLAAQFSEFARTVQQQQDPHETLVEGGAAGSPLRPLPVSYRGSWTSCRRRWARVRA